MIWLELECTVGLTLLGFLAATESATGGGELAKGGEFITLGDLIVVELRCLSASLRALASTPKNF